MKVAIIGSRKVTAIAIDEHLPKDTDEIVSGGASGVDTLAAEYAGANSIKLTEFLPNYEKFGRAAPIVRNKEIVDYADTILAFWDGSSRGTLSVINYAKKQNKPIEVIICKQ